MRTNSTSSVSDDSCEIEVGEKANAANASCGARSGVVFAVALVASSGCYALVSGETLAGSVVQTAILAVIALVAVMLVRPGALRVISRRVLVGWRGWIAFVFAVGFVGGVGSRIGELFAPGSLGALAGCVGVVQFVQAIALCLLTGVYEEGVFRVLAIDAFTSAFGGSRRCLLGATVASSVLFGVLHVSVGDAVEMAGLASVAGSIALVQIAMKSLQAALFGLFMAALYVRTRNVWLLAIVHGVFDMLYLGPSLLGEFEIAQTYVTGNPADLAFLIVTTALFVAPAVAAYKSFR